jgi:outer membrane immunogenic protein
VNSGYTRQSNSVATNANNIQFCNPLQCDGTIESVATSVAGASGSRSFNSDGFIGGGQIGYVYRVSNNLVAGIEADLQGVAGSSHAPTATTFIGIPGFSPPVDPSNSNNFIGTSVSVRKSVDYLGTVRGRLGYLVKPTLLAYTTGGLAYGGVKSSTSVSQNLTGETGGTLVTNWASAGSFAETRVGWTWGAGFEWMFGSNWSAKVEYLYYDLGKVTYSAGVLVAPFTPAGVQPPNPAFFSNAVRATTRFDGHIVRVGLSYYFI